MWRNWLFCFSLRGEGEDTERWDKILRWRHSKIHSTSYNASRRETAWVFPKTIVLEVRAGSLSGSFRLRAHRTVQTRPVSSRSVHHGIFPDVYFFTQSTATERTASNGVKERASICLVFCSLDTSSHRKFSMGYRRAKPTQGKTNFQKIFFWQTTSGSLPAGLNIEQKLTSKVARKDDEVAISFDFERSHLLKLATSLSLRRACDCLLFRNLFVL